MKRKGTLIIAVLALALIAATLVACDPSGTQSGPSGDGTATYTVTEKPAYLNVNNPTSNMAKAFVGDFSVEDITYSVVYNVETKNNLTGEVSTSTRRDEELYVADAEVLANGDEDLEKLRTAGTHVITLVKLIDGVSVTGSTKVYLKDYATTSYDVTVNFVAADGTSVSQVKSEKDGTTLSYGYSFLRKFGVPSSYTVTDDGGTVTKYLSHFEIANQAAIFAPAGTQAAAGVAVYDSLVVEAPVTLTAVYSDVEKESFDFTFAVNAPADVIWNYDSAAARENVTVSVLQNSRVSDIRNDSAYNSANYTLAYWVDANGNKFDFNGTRITADTTVTAVWTVKTFSVGVSLTSGTLNDAYEAPDTQGYKQIAATSVFNSEGQLTSVSFGGIEYNASVDQFYAVVNLNADGTSAKTVLLSDLFDGDALYRAGYDFVGVYVKGTNDVYDVTDGVTNNLSLTVNWTPDVANIDNKYYDATYEFEMLIDGTYAISSVKDAAATLLYVPAEYKGIPVTRINDGAAESKAMVTVLDLSAAVNLEYIGANAFKGCVALSEIRSPSAADSKLTYIAAGAFEGISYDLRQGHLVIGNVLVLANTGGQSTLDLSDAGFKYIAGGAFNDTNLVHIVLPDDLRGIADGAFVAVSPGATFRIETATTSMEYLGADIGLADFTDGKEDNALTIGNALYRYTGDATELDLNDTGVTVIAGGAFVNDTNLTKITWTQNQVTYIGENAFHSTFIKNNVDDNGFFVVNGILIRYSGTAKQVTLPVDVTMINTSAFANSALTNLIIPVGSQLTLIKENAFRNAGNLNVTVRAEESAAEIAFTAEVNAFTNWTGGIYVEYYPDSTTSGIGGMTTQKLYNDLLASAESEKAAMWTWLKNNKKLSVVQVVSVQIDSRKVPNVYVTSADGSVDFYEIARAWNNDPEDNTVFKENGNYSVRGAVVVRRNDGLTTAEDFVISQSDMNASFQAAAEAAQGAAVGDGYPGVLQFNASNTTVAEDLIPAGNVSGSYSYEVYAGIESVQLKDPDGNILAPDAVIALYDTYSTSLISNYYLSKCTLVVTYTNDAVEEYLLSKNANSVKMDGYDVAGTGGTLTFSYTKSYKVSSVSSTGSVAFAYTMSTPAPARLEFADNMQLDADGYYHAALNTASSVYNNLIRFKVVYDDGLTTDTVFFGNANITVTGFSTLTYGTREATAVYSKDGVTLAPFVFTYCVDATAKSDFTFAYVDASGAVILGEDGKTMITAGDLAAKPENAVAVIVAKYVGTGAVAVAVPSEFVFTDGEGNPLGTSLPVVAIGGEAFKGAYLTSVFIPAGVTSIGDGAFDGCANLTKVYLEEAADLATIGKYAFRGTSALGAIDLSATKVTSVAEGTFYNSGIVTAALGNVDEIAALAFYNCKQLSAVTTTVAENVMYVGSQAFADCYALTDLSALSTSPDAIVAEDAFPFQWS